MARALSLAGKIVSDTGLAMEEAGHYELSRMNITA